MIAVKVVPDVGPPFNTFLNPQHIVEIRPGNPNPEVGCTVWLVDDRRFKLGEPAALVTGRIQTFYREGP